MEKYIKVCFEIDEVHSLDPTIEVAYGKDFPAELLYSDRLVKCLEKFSPEASEQVKIAARCQHLKRWEIPRNTYPMDKVGYLKWRKALYIYQSEEAAKILKKVGYNDDFVDEVKALIQKKEISRNINAQTIEDIACLVFIEFYLDDFSKKHSIDKMKSIISKTWSKMSDKGQKAALSIRMSENLKLIMLEALNH